MTGDITRPSTIVRMKPAQMFWFFVGLLVLAILAALANAGAQRLIAAGQTQYRKVAAPAASNGTPQGIAALLPGV